MTTENEQPTRHHSDDTPRQLTMDRPQDAPNSQPPGKEGPPAGGWLKLWRKAMGSDVCANGTIWAIFSRLLMQATFAERELPDGTILQPGQCEVDTAELARWMGCTDRTIRRHLGTLSAINAIRVRKRVRYKPIVTLVNWATYQTENQNVSANVSAINAIPVRHRKESKEYIPPPAPPQKIGPNPPARGEGGGDWEEITKQLTARGVRFAQEATDAARRNGTPPGEVGDAIAHWDAHTGAWGPQALYSKIANMGAQESGRENWPTPSARYQDECARREREESDRRRAEERRREDERRQESAAAEAALERDHGSAVDELAAEVARAMLRERLGPTARLYTKKIKQGEPITGAARQMLLQMIAEASG